MEGIYKKLLPIPMILLVLSIGLLVNGYAQTGEWFLRSVELKGGTIITVSDPGTTDIRSLENVLSQFGVISVKEIKGIGGSSFSIEIGTDVDPDQVLQEMGQFGIDPAESSVQTIGSSLSESFWVQAQVAIIAAFVMMSIIVFVIFRTPVPSIAVILAAASDIIITLAFMQAFSIQLSFASLAAILTLIGYSVDTDVLLTTKVIKGGGALNSRIKGAMKTGLTMTATTLGALAAIIIVSISQVLTQIATVLLIGLIVDMATTWIQNTAIMEWYAKKRGMGNV